MQYITLCPWNVHKLSHVYVKIRGPEGSTKQAYSLGLAISEDERSWYKNKIGAIKENISRPSNLNWPSSIERRSWV